MHTSGGATTAVKVAQVLGRNFPLVLLLVMIGALFWPTENVERVDEDQEDQEGLEDLGARRPNGRGRHGQHP
jgi:hypothetical protein